MVIGLSDFIAANNTLIVDECEAFARTLGPAAEDMDREALRDHIGQILVAIAAAATLGLAAASALFWLRRRRWLRRVRRASGAMRGFAAMSQACCSATCVTLPTSRA